MITLAGTHQHVCGTIEGLKLTLDASLLGASSMVSGAVVRAIGHRRAQRQPHASSVHGAKVYALRCGRRATYSCPYASACEADMGKQYHYHFQQPIAVDVLVVGTCLTCGTWVPTSPACSGSLWVLGSGREAVSLQHVHIPTHKTFAIDALRPTPAPIGRRRNTMYTYEGSHTVPM
jgi:hypothetical protein